MHRKRARGGFWGFWKTHLIELNPASGEDGWLSLARGGLGQVWHEMSGGGRWKSQNRKNVYLSPYVEEPLNSKVIKSFVPELRSRKCFSCFEFPMLYVYIYIYMNIICPFCISVPKVPITIGIIVTFMFHNFFQFSSKVKVLISLFTFFQFYSVVSWDSKVDNFAGLHFFFFCWLLLGLVFWPRLGNPLVYQSPIGVCVCHFLGQVLGCADTICWHGQI